MSENTQENVEVEVEAIDLTDESNWTPALFADPNVVIDFEAATSDLAGRNAGIVKAKGDLMFHAALTVYRGFEVTKVLGTGAGQTSRNAYATKVGVTPAYITKCRRLGAALAVHGVEYGTSTWQDLSKVVNSGKATRDLIDGAVGEDGVSVPVKVEDLIDAVKADGDRSKAASAKGGKAASTAQDAQTPVPTTAEDKAAAASESVKAAMQSIRDAMPNLSESDLRALVNGLATLRTEVTAAVKALPKVDAKASA